MTSSQNNLQQGIDYTGVSIVFFCHDGRGNFLFNKRSKNCRDEHGRWDPGGGGLDFGEDIEETLRREIKEEFCTEVLSTEFLGYRDVHRVDDDGNKTHWLALDFKVLVDREMVANGEPHKFDEVGWFNLEELPEPVHSQYPAALKKYRHQLMAIDDLEQPVGCCMIVRNEKGEILLGKRKNSYGAGKYGLPGGRLDGEERLVNCAKRELTEETGLKAKKVEYVGAVREWRGSYNFIHFIYVCQGWSGQPKVKEPDRCESWQWFDLDKLPKGILSGHAAGIDMLHDRNFVRDL